MRLGIVRRVQITADFVFEFGFDRLVVSQRLHPSCGAVADGEAMSCGRLAVERAGTYRLDTSRVLLLNLTRGTGDTQAGSPENSFRMLGFTATIWTSLDALPRHGSYSTAISEAWAIFRPTTRNCIQMGGRHGLAESAVLFLVAVFALAFLVEGTTTRTKWQRAEVCRKGGVYANAQGCW